MNQERSPHVGGMPNGGSEAAAAQARGGVSNLALSATTGMNSAFSKSGAAVATTKRNTGSGIARLAVGSAALCATVTRTNHPRPDSSGRPRYRRRPTLASNRGVSTFRVARRDCIGFIDQTSAACRGTGCRGVNRLISATRLNSAMNPPLPIAIKR